MKKVYLLILYITGILLFTINSYADAVNPGILFFGFFFIILVIFIILLICAAITIIIKIRKKNK